MNNLRVALVGYGYWGPNLARNIKVAKGLELSLIIERDPIRSMMARHDHDVEVLEDFDRLKTFGFFDVVFIATNPAEHLVVTELTLPHTTNIVIAKPISNSLKNIKKLGSLAEKFNVNVFCDYTYRYSSIFSFIKEWSAINPIEEYVSFRHSLGIYQADLSVIEDLASHDFSLINGIGWGKPSSIKTLDTSPFYFGASLTSASLYCVWEAGMSAQVHVSWNAPKKIRYLVLRSGSKFLIIDELNSLQPVREIILKDRILDFPLDFKDKVRRNTRVSIGEERVVSIDIQESLSLEMEILESALRNSDYSSLVTIDDATSIWEMISMSQTSIMRP